MHIAWVGKQARGTPQQPLTTRLLQPLEDQAHVLEVGIRIVDRLALRGDVPVMEAVVVDADLLKELEEHLGAALRVFQSVRSIVPWGQRRTDPERIGQFIPHRVPVTAGKAQVLAHRLAFDLGVRVVPLERQRVAGVGAPIRDDRDVLEVLTHVSSPIGTAVPPWHPTSQA